MLNDSENCVNCKHYQFGLKCKAFPDGIPPKVVTWNFPHVFRHPEQGNDILFTPRTTVGPKRT